METATATSDEDLRAPSRRFSITASKVFWLVLGLTAAGAAIRLPTLGLQSYHHDEAITVARVLPGSFGHMLHEVHRSESTPPLYYLLAWPWSKAFGLGEAELRSLSAIFGIVTIPLAFLIGRELAGRRAGLLTAAFVAVNPMLIWYSQEARSYALLILLCAASLLFFLRFRRTGTRRDLVLWSLFSALSLTSHYFAAFPVAIESAWLVLGPRSRRPVLVAVGAVLAVGLMLVPYVMAQANPTHIDWIGATSLGSRLEDAGAGALIGETGKVIGAAGPHNRYAVVPGFLIAVLAGLALLAGRPGELRGAAVGLVIGCGTVGLTLLAAAVGKDYVLARNLLPALLPLLAAIAVAAAGIRARRLGVAIAVALCVYWLAFDIRVDTTQGLQRPDFRAIAEKIGPPRVPRAIVTWTLGIAPLQIYLHDGSERIGVGGGPLRVAEVDLVTKRGASSPFDSLAGRFPRRELVRLGRFTLIRYRAAQPVTVGLRLLRHQPTGFVSNGVMVDGATGSTIGPLPTLPQPPLRLLSLAQRPELVATESQPR